jgi:hypothetical protein
MNMTKIVCPKCSAEAKLSLVDANYTGPRRCWKCHEYFTIAIENNRVTYCEPLSPEEFEKQQAAKKAAEKSGSGIAFSGTENRQASFDFAERESRGGIEFAEQKKTEEVEKPMESLWKSLKSFVPKETSAQPDPPKTASVYPPEKVRIFEPLHETNPEPEKPRWEKRQPDIIGYSRKETSAGTDPDARGTVFPPGPPRTFVPLEETEPKYK